MFNISILQFKPPTVEKAACHSEEQWAWKGGKEKCFFQHPHVVVMAMRDLHMLSHLILMINHMR